MIDSSSEPKPNHAEIPDAGNMQAAPEQAQHGPAEGAGLGAQAESPVEEYVCPICDHLIPLPPPEFCPHCSAHLQLVTSLLRAADLSIAEASRDISIGDLLGAERRLEFVRTASKKHRVKAEIVHAQILRIKGNPGAALAHLYAVRDDLDVEDSELSKLYEDTVARCIRDQADLAACCEFYNFGLFQAQRGHYEEARQSLAKALEIVPHHAQTHALLGKIFHALRIRDEARYHLSRALAVDPTNVSASRMMARMDWLRFRLPVERWLSSLNITPQVAASVFVVVVLILIALAALLNRG